MKNILLIEDEDNLNRGISLKLQKEGYTVFSAATVAEGLSLFQANTIDLVICDIGLPDGSGLDLCASIRQKSDVLFLFLTALDTEVDMITGYEMGADDYVTKPFSMSVLISKISAMLKRTEKTISNVVQTGELTFYINIKLVYLLKIQNIMQMRDLKKLKKITMSLKLIYISGRRKLIKYQIKNIKNIWNILKQ